MGPGAAGEGSRARIDGTTCSDGWSGQAMGINELILVGTGFVLARVVYLFYFAPRKRVEADRR
jgi:hypothetical protein